MNRLPNQTTDIQFKSMRITAWLPLFFASLKRIGALLRKETRQMLRDPSNLAIGILLPLLLIIIFGYGLSLDVRNVKVAVVIQKDSAPARDVVAGLRLSPYFLPRVVPSWAQAENSMRQGEVDAIVVLPADFARNVAQGMPQLQTIVNGRDANYARIVQNYLNQALGQSFARKNNHEINNGNVILQPRMWFNDAQMSSYFLVPGLIVLIMTLIGALLTSLVMAREWERGTLESLFVTPVRVIEILLAKIIPYFFLGMGGLGLCVIATRFLFQVPMQGSFWVFLWGSVLYLWVALGIGLLISSAVKSQFLASQIVLIVSFVPALMLSGFLFDLRSAPRPVEWVAHLLPATWYVEFLQTLFLAGNVWPVLLKDGAILAIYAFVLLFLVHRTTQKTLEVG